MALGVVAAANIVLQVTRPRQKDEKACVGALDLEKGFVKYSFPEKI